MNLADVQSFETRRQQACQAARRLAEEARAHFGPRLRQATLFGSAARGDWGPESDVDVLVLLDRVDAQDREWLAARAMRLGLSETGVQLQPIPMAESRFADLAERERLFARQIQQDGIPL